MAIDFVSMYPSIIVSSNISPESIDVVDRYAGQSGIRRFNRIECYTDFMSIRSVMRCVRIASSYERICIHPNSVTNISLNAAVSFDAAAALLNHTAMMNIGDNMILTEPHVMVCVDMSVCKFACDLSSDTATMCPKILVDRDLDMMRVYSITRHGRGTWYWEPSVGEFKGHSVDWIVTPLGVAKQNGR